MSHSSRQTFIIIHAFIHTNLFFISLAQDAKIEKLINSFNQIKSLGLFVIAVQIHKNQLFVLKQPMTFLIDISFK